MNILEEKFNEYVKNYNLINSIQFNNDETNELIYIDLLSEQIKILLLSQYYKNNYKKGYIYCMYNTFFENSVYGQNLYKLGCTKNIIKRTKPYTTSYIDDVEIKLKMNIDSYKIAEDILFYKLKKYRVKKTREFFTVKIDYVNEIFLEIKILFEKNDVALFVFNNNIIRPKDLEIVTKFIDMIVNQIEKQKNDIIDVNDDTFNDLEKKFLEDFVNDKMNYESNFIINFDIVCKWLYVRKDNLKLVLKKNFDINHDYIIEKKQKIQKNSTGRTTYYEIYITVECFKKICNSCKTKDEQYRNDVVKLINKLLLIK